MIRIALAIAMLCTLLPTDIANLEKEREKQLKLLKEQAEMHQTLFGESDK